MDSDWDLDLYDSDDESDHDKPENKVEELKEIKQFFEFMKLQKCNGWKSEIIVVGLPKFKMMQIICSPLPSNFIQRRINLENRLKSMKRILLKRYHEYRKGLSIPDPDISFLLEACQDLGLYKLAIKMVNCNYAYYLSTIESQIALEKYEEMIMICSAASHILLPLSKCNKYNDTVHYYIISTFFMLYKDEIIKSNKETEYKGIHLGYTMIFGADLLFEWIQRKEASDINRRFIHEAKKKRSFISWAKKMKTWSLHDIKKKGKQFYLKGCMRMRIKKDISKAPDPEINYIRGQYENMVNKDYDKAKMYYIVAITSERTSMLCPHLINRVVGLIGLTRSCYKNQEYIIGKKSLNIAYKLCGKYFMQSFVKNDYGKFKRKMNRKLANMKCDNCGDICIKLKCCTGCMTAFYCNRKCQKIHWKYMHNNQCNFSWRYLYPIIRNSIFQAL